MIITRKEDLAYVFVDQNKKETNAVHLKHNFKAFVSQTEAKSCNMKTCNKCSRTTYFGCEQTGEEI
jgi:hypothetical protein